MEPFQARYCVLLFKTGLKTGLLPEDVLGVPLRGIWGLHEEGNKLRINVFWGLYWGPPILGYYI